MLLVPESRPPLIDLTAGPDAGGPPAGSQPDLFDAFAQPGGTGPADPATSGGLGAAGRACTAALVDVVAGRRAPQQLARWTTEQVLADLVTVARSARRHPVRAAHPYLQVSDRAAEIVIPLVPTQGGWAPLRVLTARVEPYAGRWRCCHLGWVAAPHRPD
jgi:hypothetical protein